MVNNINANKHHQINLALNPQIWKRKQTVWILHYASKIFVPILISLLPYKTSQEYAFVS